MSRSCSNTRNSFEHFRCRKIRLLSTHIPAHKLLHCAQHSRVASHRVHIDQSHKVCSSAKPCLSMILCTCLSCSDDPVDTISHTLCILPLTCCYNSRHVVPHRTSRTRPRSLRRVDTCSYRSYHSRHKDLPGKMDLYSCLCTPRIVQVSHLRIRLCTLPHCTSRNSNTHSDQVYVPYHYTRLRDTFPLRSSWHCSYTVHNRLHSYDSKTPRSLPSDYVLDKTRTLCTHFHR